MLRDLKGFAAELELHQLKLEIRQIEDKLTDNSFSIAVVGEFKRGKSTFINSLLGVDILPADVLPATATINRVTYGQTPGVKIVFRDGHEELIALEQLNDYITNLTLESSQRASTIKEALIYYPISFCRDNNLEIIDTPGLQDSKNLTEITESILPQLDAAIFVMMAQSPLSITELNFLTKTLLTQDLGKVMFVITGIDLCPSPQDASRLITNIKQKLQQKILEYAQDIFDPNSPQYQAYLHKIGELKVFGISASMGLEGKISGNQELLEQSQLKVFEAALRSFLEREKGIVLLEASNSKVNTFCKPILEKIKQKNQGLNQLQAEIAQSYDRAIAKLTTQENNCRQNLSPSNLTEITKIQEQQREKRVIWERAGIVRETKQRNLQRIARETQEILSTVESIARYLQSLKPINSLDLTE